MSKKNEVGIDKFLSQSTGCLPIYDLFAKDTYEEDNRGVASSTDPFEPGGKVQESAVSFLEEAKAQMEARARLRDSESGERTAAKIAAVFNALTGHNLSEADAWTFLLIMKLVRAQAGNYHRDDYVDACSYAGLLGECESTRERK